MKFDSKFLLSKLARRILLPQNADTDAEIRSS